MGRADTVRSAPPGACRGVEASTDLGQRALAQAPGDTSTPGARRHLGVVVKLCEYMFPDRDHSLCWRLEGHSGQHQQKHEVEGLRREYQKVRELEAKKKRDD